MGVFWLVTAKHAAVIERGTSLLFKPKFHHYVHIARPDHWVKHIFIVPGCIAAWILVGQSEPNLFLRLVLGFVSACLLSSANYVINEWLDSEHDAHHPLKRQRPGAQGLLSGRLVILEYVLFAAFGLWSASALGRLFFLTAAAFVVSGVVYNVPPLRTKSFPYFDVVTESVNNPIRLTLGWAMVSSATVPPLSLVGAYWFGGAFLMAAKRLAEYRFISDTVGVASVGLYRKSFSRYSVSSLLISCFVYSVMASFLLAVFLLKYRSEYVLSFPFFTALFAYYLYIALQPGSAAQKPEMLHRDFYLVGMLFSLMVVMTILTFVDMPIIDTLIQSRFTVIRLGN